MTAIPPRTFPGCLILLGLSFGVLALAEPAAREAAGTIAGVVRFTGKVPPPQEVLTTEGGTIRHSDLVVDSKTKGLRDVVAMLENAPVQAPAKKAPLAVVDQRDMLFKPRVVAVQHGQTVRFENSDTCNHSVIANSTVRANQFNLFVPSTMPYDHVFEAQKHPVMMGCSLHAWMRAYVYVLPHPWFAVSDTEGKFRIENVPPGKYMVWLRHPDTGKQDRREVEVKAGQAVEMAIEWDREK